MLKLDFLKAFDSINWECLCAVMRARGFPSLWCDWMDLILSSSKSAILLNGIPGVWIDCKRGLRQGDPLSPYLFNSTADLLPQMLISASDEGYLAHPTSLLIYLVLSFGTPTILSSCLKQHQTLPFIFVVS